MSIIEKILGGPIDSDLARELAEPQEEMTQKTSAALSTMALVNIGHVVALVNVSTGIVTIASNLTPDLTIRLLRDTADSLERGQR